MLQLKRKKSATNPASAFIGSKKLPTSAMLECSMLLKKKNNPMDDLIEIYKETLRKIHGESKSEEELEKLVKEIIGPRLDKETFNKSIIFAYYRGMISEEEIEQFKNRIENIGFQFYKKDKSKEIYNSFTDFLSEVVLILGSDVTRTILLGAMGSGIWALVIELIENLREKIEGKKIKKISSSGIKEEVDIVLHLKLKIDEISDIDFQIGEEVSRLELENILDKALIITKKENDKDVVDLVNAKKRYKYNLQTKNWELVEFRRNQKVINSKNDI